MSAQDVEHYLLHTEISAPSLAQAKRETLCDVNPLADWLNTKVLHTPGSRTQVGIAQRVKDPADPKFYRDTDTYLYANYAKYCEVTGSQKVSLRRFSSLLQDLCRSQLDWRDVERGRDRNGSYFLGLAIRAREDTSPPPITSPPVTEHTSPVTDPVTGETLASDGCDECDEFSAKTFPIRPHSTPSPPDPTSIENFSKIPSHPSHLSPERILASTPPVTVLPDPSHPPPASRKYRPPIRAGDVCRYCGPPGAMGVTCRGRDLLVLDVKHEVATVKAEKWFHPHEIAPSAQGAAWVGSSNLMPSSPPGSNSSVGPVVDVTQGKHLSQAKV
jgi:hypothetical protein